MRSEASVGHYISTANSRSGAGPGSNPKLGKGEAAAGERSPAVVGSTQRGPQRRSRFRLGSVDLISSIQDSGLVVCSVVENVVIRSRGGAWGRQSASSALSRDVYGRPQEP